MDYLIQNEDGILTFTINREEKRNAINYAVMDGLKEVITYIKEHNDVRFLVITGGKNHFARAGTCRNFIVWKQKKKRLAC